MFEGEKKKKKINSNLKISKHKWTQGEVTGLPKTQSYRTDETFSAPGKGRHMDCQLVALSSLITRGSEKGLFQQSPPT